jgi:hypothetical protein
MSRSSNKKSVTLKHGDVVRSVGNKRHAVQKEGPAEISERSTGDVDVDEMLRLGSFERGNSLRTKWSTIRISIGA